MDGGLRNCGECIVCCVYPVIRDPYLQKPGMTNCSNLGLETDELQWTGPSCKNCKIYDKRPTMCAKYECAWKAGYGDDEDRPDKVNLLFDGAKQIPNSLECKPLKNHAESTPEGMAVIDRMSRTFETPVIVLDFFERKIQRLVGRGL